MTIASEAISRMRISAVKTNWTTPRIVENSLGNFDRQLLSYSDNPNAGLGGAGGGTGPFGGTGAPIGTGSGKDGIVPCIGIVTRQLGQVIEV